MIFMILSKAKWKDRYVYILLTTKKKFGLTLSYISLILLFIPSVHKTAIILLATALKIASLKFAQDMFFFIVQTRVLQGYRQAFAILPTHHRAQKSSAEIQYHPSPFSVQM